MKFESRFHSLVINFNDVLTNDVKVICCIKSRFKEAKFIGITHTRDYDDEGVMKVPHIHLYLEFPKKIKTQAIITEFMEYFENFTKDVENAISDRKVFCKNKCIRYLLHLDDSEKSRYYREELFYNDNDLLDYLELVNDIDYSYLSQLVSECNTLCEVYSRLGDINTCSRFRSIIIDMFYDRGVFKRFDYETSKRDS